LPSCEDLETGIELPSPESVDLARQWLLDVDDKIQVHQLRQFLQTTSLASDEALGTMLGHYLHKATRGESDRDKVDFLLVQYFSHCAPSRLEDTDVQYVAQVLEPVLGHIADPSVPDWLAPLENCVEKANACQNLNELFTSRLLEEGRKQKTSAGDKFFQPAAMVTFTRFSFLMRRIFFRLMHQDLNIILDGLRELELRGVGTLDCRKAQFSAEEPISRLRMICQSWKVMFHAEYSSGQPLCLLVDLRTAVDMALAHSEPGHPGQAKAPLAKSKAVSAAAGFAVQNSDSAEFEVSPAPPEWDPDSAQ
jgi:hypothetical protein